MGGVCASRVSKRMHGKQIKCVLLPAQACKPGAKGGSARAHRACASGSPWQNPRACEPTRTVSTAALGKELPLVAVPWV
eukprot:1141834-Pelagomonas_calceolata.AAC.9